MSTLTDKQANNAISELNSLQQHGIITDLARLLRSRHWAQKLKLFSNQAARSTLLGETRSRFRGRGMEFEEVRRYQPGDDIRTIDWRVSARTGKTHTKLFCEERERPVHILVDQRSSLYFGSQKQFKSVLAAELATGIAWAALAGSDRVGGQVIGQLRESDSRARRNKQAVLKLIHDLNELNHELPAAINNSEHAAFISIAQSIEECRRITRPGTAVFIISDFNDFDEAATKQLSNLGKHTDLTLLQVRDDLERELPVLGRVPISDGQHKRTIRLGNQLKEAYQQQLEARQQRLNNAALGARARFTKIDTRQSARDALTQLFA